MGQISFCEGSQHVNAGSIVDLADHLPMTAPRQGSLLEYSVFISQDLKQTLFRLQINISWSLSYSIPMEILFIEN